MATGVWARLPAVRTPQPVEDREAEGTAVSSQSGHDAPDPRLIPVRPAATTESIDAWTW